MHKQPRIGIDGDRLLDRRTLLTGALAAWLGASCRAGQPDQVPTEEDQELRAVEAIAAKAGLAAFGTTRSPHYLGVGDASETFRSVAIRDCEAVAADYLDYFRSQGFKVAMPARRLIVVILTDERSRGAFNAGPGLPISPSGGGGGPNREHRPGDRGRAAPNKANRFLVAPGHYEQRTNRVVLNLRAKASRSTAPLNLRVLVHEATHQLTFNTGLLDRRGDVPKAIGEGLAQFGEIRKTTEKVALGQPHEPNLYVLVRSRRFGPPWYPFAQLLTDDRAFQLSADSRLQQIAYAQAWLLIDYLMKAQSRREAFRAYLEAIRPRVGPEHRLDDAKKHLGDLDRLNQDLVSYFVRLNRGL
jgi:Protein of unknown function (DUF1570)